MPFFSQTVLILLASFFIALSGLFSVTLGVAASPLPIYLPRKPVDYTPLSLDASHLNPRAVESTVAAMEDNSFQRRDTLQTLHVYYKGASHSASYIKDCAKQSKAGRSDADFQEKCASKLKDFHENIDRFQTTLAEGKGLEHFDKNNDLEKLVKDFINLNKNTLDDISKLVDSIPILGPVLGPLVYKIKCVLDELLNATENLTDEIINLLQPLLQSLFGKPTGKCTTGIELLGMCL